MGAFFLIESVFFHNEKITAEENNESYKYLKKPCWFDADWQADISCGELHTPSRSGKFILPVVILHPEQLTQKDPVVYLQGGPGASAGLHSEGIKRWLSWMRLANIKRDLILLDVRGTGKSKPALVCAEYNRTNQQLLREHKPLSEELAQSFSVTGQCFKEAMLQDPSLDYRNFSTRLSAQDVRALMAQLDYTEWNILGVSYGTRLALEVARQEQQLPQSVRLRSMVLDSIYPAGYGGVQTWPQVLDAALQKFFKGCPRLPDCSNHLKNNQDKLQELFMSALARLRDNPMTITIKHWDGEAPMRWVVNDHRFLSIVFAGIYEPNDWSKIADAVQAVHDGRSDLLKPLAEPYLNHSVSSDFNSLTFTAVDCADNPVFPEADYLNVVAQYPLLQNYTRDQWRYQLCHQLPSVAALELVKPLVPTLILAGAQDPITPVQWARQIHEQWPESQLRVSEHLAHSVLGSDVCLLENIASFFDQPNVAFTACTSLARLSN